MPDLQSHLKNEHGLWLIGRIIVPSGHRYTLHLWLGDEKGFVLVANQGRRKTCVELANAGYRVAELKGE